MRPYERQEWNRSTDNKQMSKQTAPLEMSTGSGDKTRTSVIDQGPPKVGAQQLKTIKQEQKHRVDELDEKTLIKLYRQMLLVRRFEEKAAEAYSRGKIGGFCHLYIGQEAVAIGAISAIRTEDYVLTSYREHGHAIAKGISADAVMAELFGKAGGCSRGKGGSMHMFDRNVNFLGGHAIVGGQIPLLPGWPLLRNTKARTR